MTHDEAVLVLARFGAMVVRNWHENDTMGFQEPFASELDDTAVAAGVQENLYGEGLGCSLCPGIAAAVDRLLPEAKDVSE